MIYNKAKQIRRYGAGDVTPKATKKAQKKPVTLLESVNQIIQEDLTPTFHIGPYTPSFVTEGLYNHIIGDDPELTELDLNKGRTYKSTPQSYPSQGNIILGGGFVGPDAADMLPMAEAAKRYKDSKIFYGVTKDGRFVVGGPNEIDPNVEVLPSFKGGRIASVVVDPEDVDNDTPLHLLDESGNVMYHNLENNAGKIIVFDPTTGAKVFLHGKPRDVGRRIQEMMKNNNNLHYMLLDNGVFNDIIRKQKGPLTADDYRDWYSRTGEYPNKVFNLIYSYE